MPMTPGLVGNIRQAAPEEEPLAAGDIEIEIIDNGQSTEKFDKNGAIL